jgi:cytochrome c-L
MKKHLIQAAIAIMAFAFVPVIALADLDFRNTVTGEPLDLSKANPVGRDTPAVKEFLQTGHDPYIEVKACLPKGEELFLVACSGCHGHTGEGKIGPGLNDNYWTYPKNVTDKGLFETIYGGARAMMGPHSDLQLNEIMLIMAWIRHFYTGPVADAEWLTDDQKKTFTPFDPTHPQAVKVEGACEISAQ